MGERATYFFVATFFLLVFPLLPLEAEGVFTGHVDAKSMSVVTCTFAISIAFGSRNEFVGWFGLIVGVLFAFVYGVALGRGNEALGSVYVVTQGAPPMQGWALWNTAGTGILLALHLIERFVRHAVRGEAFPDFIQRRRT
jgi:hypothetical protein